MKLIFGLKQYILFSGLFEIGMACAVVDPNQQEWTSKTKSLNPFFGKKQIYRYVTQCRNTMI